MEYLKSLTNLITVKSMWYILFKIIIIVALIFIWPKLIKTINKFFEKSLNRARVDALLISFTSSLITVIMYICLIYVIIGVLGFQAASLITLLGTASLAVGLALQGSLSNLAGGVLILFFKPFKKGDAIAVNGLEGEVLHIQMLYTTIVTFDNQVIIIPNSQISNSPILNYSHNTERRLTLHYSASYDSPVDDVIKALNEVAESEPKILKHRPILIRLYKHNDSSLDYIFRVWTLRTNYFEVAYNCNEKVRKIFIERGIEIPYPKMDIYHKNEQRKDIKKNIVNACNIKINKDFCNYTINGKNIKAKFKNND